jgi:hypothetical protein
MRYAVAVIVVAGTLLGGCKKESPVETPSPASLFVFSAKITHPITNTTEPHAQSTKDYIASLNGFAIPDWLAPFSSVTPTFEGNTTTWKSTQGALTQTFSETSQADGSIAWRHVYNGSDGVLSYSNWVVRSGVNASGGKSVQWSAFQPNSVLKAFDFFASGQADSTVVLILIQCNAGGATTGKIAITQTANKSGFLDSYRYDGEQFLNWFESQWGADGSGSWIDFDANGQPQQSGTWSK